MAGPPRASIVVLAAADSGASRVAAALGAHSQVHFLTDGASVLGDVTGPGDSAEHAAAGERLARRLTTDALAAGTPPVLDASGSHVDPEALAEALPSATFVHVVRDGRAVALARARDRGQQSGLAAFGRAWVSEITPLLRLDQVVPDRVLKVAWEDLLTDPGATLERLCDALGLAPEADALSAVLANALEPADRLAFRADAFDDWQLVDLEAAASPILGLLGYRPAGDLATLAQLRARADARRGGDRASHARAQDGAVDEAGVIAAELARLRLELQRRDESIAELRLALSEPPEGPLDLPTLRWKAKRYDQIRATASLAARIRRGRNRR